jgi:membrane protease YdiL (CAAX protease family)
MCVIPTISGRRLLLAIGIWFAIWAAATVVTLESMIAAGVVSGDPRLHRHESTDFAAMWLAEAYLALLAALMIAFGGLAGLRENLGFRFTSWRHMGLALVIWLLATFTAVVLLSLQALLLRQEARSNTEELLRLARNPLFVGVIVPTLTLLGPATEEMFFRGALFGWLRGRLPVAWSIVISAAIFGALHFLLTLFVALFVFGLAAAVVYQLTGSTLNSFLMHACQNTAAVAATYVLLATRAG